MGHNHFFLFCTGTKRTYWTQRRAWSPRTPSMYYALKWDKDRNACFWHTLNYFYLFQGRPGLNGLRGLKGDRGEAFNVSFCISISCKIKSVEIWSLIYIDSFQIMMGLKTWNVLEIIVLLLLFLSSSSHWKVHFWVCLGSTCRYIYLCQLPGVTVMCVIHCCHSSFKQQRIWNSSSFIYIKDFLIQATSVTSHVLKIPLQAELSSPGTNRTCAYHREVVSTLLTKGYSLLSSEYPCSSCQIHVPKIMTSAQMTA